MSQYFVLSALAADFVFVIFISASAARYESALRASLKAKEYKRKG